MPRWRSCAAFRPIVGKDVEQYTVRAQYAEGNAHEQPVPGYRREKKGESQPITETYVAVKAFVENWRWAGVPFICAPARPSPNVPVKWPCSSRYSADSVQRQPAQPQPANVLTLRIQPDEGLSLRIISRVPGTRAQTHPVEMDFQYSDVFGCPPGSL